MARSDKQRNWETDYVDKVAFLNGLATERIAFLATFILPGHEEEKEESTDSGGGEGDAAQTVSGNSNEEKTWNFFAQKGFTAGAVAAIMGNLNQESKFSTTIVNKSSGATGLGQWLGGRLTGLRNWAKKEGKKFEDIETQLEWLWKELNGGDPTTKSILDKRYGGMDALKKMPLEKAVVAYEASFERSGGSMISKRITYAKEYLAKYGGGNGSAAAKTVGGSSNAKGDAKKIIDYAMSWTKKPNRYVFGGGRTQADINAGRLDCSSFCRLVFAECGYNIMGHDGLWGNTDTVMGNKKLKHVKTSELQPGDLVFFDTYKTYGHITIYLGNNRVIGTQKSTGVAPFDMYGSYWKNKISKQHVRVL